MQEQKGEEQDRGKVKADDELGLICLDKFFDCGESDCVEKPGDNQSTLSNRLGQVQGNLSQEIAITTKRRVLKDGK